MWCFWLSIPVAVAGCSLDLAALEGAALQDAGGLVSAVDDRRQPPPGDGDGDGDGDRGRGDEMVGDGDGGGEGPGGFVPAEPTPTPDGATCGLVGLPCCRPDNRCDIGACLRGECSAYAGAFATREGCTTAMCSDRDPYSAGCACPQGFLEVTAAPLATTCDDGSPAQKVLSVCQSERTDASGWGGFWLRSGGPACGSSCVVSNPYTEDCSCPAGMALLTAPVSLGATGCAGDVATLGVCMRSGLTTGRFAGGYVLTAGAGNGCGTPNPDTGLCTCPPAAMEQRITLGGGVTVGLCSL